MTWAGGHLESAADALWVDDYLLSVRLRSLAGREKDYVERQLADVPP
jgi:hypothetical protein